MKLIKDITVEIVILLFGNKNIDYVKSIYTRK